MTIIKKRAVKAKHRVKVLRLRIAIVLGIIGLILGAIWSAAASVYQISVLHTLIPTFCSWLKMYADSMLHPHPLVMVQQQHHATWSRRCLHLLTLVQPIL